MANNNIARGQTIASNSKNASSVKNLGKVFGIAKPVKPVVDNSIRNAKGQPTGQMNSGAGWGGEVPVGGASHTSKK